MSKSDQDTEHFNQTPRRKAEFMRPVNVLKQKVGSGGLSDDILNRAQKLLEENSVDFKPLAIIYLASLMNGINMAKGAKASDDTEEVIANMLYPAMQLKANGGMFQYALMTIIADKLIQFLEVIKEPDIESVEIVLAFHTTMEAVIYGEIKGDGGKQGKELVHALTDACMRYFAKHPETYIR